VARLVTSVIRMGQVLQLQQINQASLHVHAQHLFMFMHVFFESLLFAKHGPLALQIVAAEYCSMRMMSLYSEHWPNKSTELYHLLTSCV
jgi:hypothetical protein